jgi:hypothetical protein
MRTLQSECLLTKGVCKAIPSTILLRPAGQSLVYRKKDRSPLEDPGPQRVTLTTGRRTVVKDRQKIR